MKFSTNIFGASRVALILRQVMAVVSVATLIANGFVGVGFAAQQQQSAARRLSEEQRIIHVLSRLSFGARPGDVERIKKLGVDRYIEQQLMPSQIDDATLEAKLREFPTLQMKTAELFAKYPQPGGIIRKLQFQGTLPKGDVAMLGGGQQAMNTAATTAGNGGSAMNTSDAEMSGSDNSTAKASGASATAMPNESGGKAGAGGKPSKAEYRAVVRQYYIDNNLLSPQLLTSELQSARILRAAYSERQLQEVMVDFWSNHFNVFSGKSADRWLLTAYDRDVIRPRALTKFSDLLRATAESPAMLFYLDNYQSISPNSGGNLKRRGGQSIGARKKLFSAQINNQQPQQQQDMANRQARRAAKGAAAAAGKNQKRVLNRNAEAMPAATASAEMNASMSQQQMQAMRQPKRPKRGINENYARELMELHTLGVDGGYTQNDIQEVARCFTGWTIFNPRGYNIGKNAPSIINSRNGQFYFNPNLHDDNEKIVLGHKIPAGGGVDDGLMVLDILAKHPSTAKFIATKLARRFVIDMPTPALVERVAAVYTKTDGDIPQVLRAIFSSPEFNSSAAYRAKIKTPFEVAISAVRALGAETNGGPALHQWITQMGEPLYGYQAPTGYPDTSEAWVSTGALLSRVNFALALASNRIRGTRVPLNELAKGSSNSSTDDLAANRNAALHHLLSIVLHGNVSPATKATILKQLNSPVNAAAAGATLEIGDIPEQSENPMNTLGGKNRRNNPKMASARMPAGTNSEVARMVGLILGSPEFQRQ